MAFFYYCVFTFVFFSRPHLDVWRLLCTVRTCIDLSTNDEQVSSRWRLLYQKRVQIYHPTSFDVVSIYAMQYTIQLQTQVHTTLRFLKCKTYANDVTLEWTGKKKKTRCRFSPFHPPQKLNLFTQIIAYRYKGPTSQKSLA